MSLPNFSQYVPPGVYWSQTASPVTNPSGVVTPSVVAIVGPGLGYQTNTDQITLVTGSPNPAVTLSELGINLASVVVTSQDGSITYTVTTDYVLTPVASTDGQSIDTTTTIKIAASGSTITNNEVVNVSYQYTNYAYTSPTYCNDFQTVQSIFGAAFNVSTGAILSPLSLAAKFAFDNGATQLVLIDCGNSGGNATRTLLSAAYIPLSALNDINIVVVLPVGMTGTSGSPNDIINVATDLQNYLSSQESTNNLLQEGLIGYETSVTVPPDVIAQAVAYKRVVEAWPNQMTIYNGYINTVQSVGGYYLAAASAGILAGNPIQQGLTKQTVRGFSGISPLIFSTMTNTYKNQLSAAGVCVTEITRNNQIQIRHGVTTDPTSVYTREISLVRSEDYMVESLVDSLDFAGLIGSPITGDTTSVISGICTGALNNLVSAGVINGFSGLSVQQDNSDPTRIDVTFQYLPAYPLNYITIVFSIDTTTGNVTTGATNSGGATS